MLALQLNVTSWLEESPERERGACPSANSRRDCRARDAHFRKGANAKNEERSQHDVDDIRDPEHTHRDRRVTGATKDSVRKKQHHDTGIAADHHARKACSRRDDIFLSAE